MLKFDSYNLCLYRLLCRCNISSPIYIYTKIISMLYIIISCVYLYESWKNLMPTANSCTESFSQEHGSKFNISLSSQKEIQLVEISQHLCVAISWNTFNYSIISFLAFSQSIQLHCLFLGHQVCWNSLHFDPNCKDCRHRIRVGKNWVSLTTNLVLWISSNDYYSFRFRVPH